MENNFNPKDKITMDVPLFIRLLEFAREDAKTDMDLHNVAENIIELSQSGETLTMTNYDAIVSSVNDKIQEIKKMQYIAGIIK